MASVIRLDTVGVMGMGVMQGGGTEKGVDLSERWAPQENGHLLGCKHYRTVLLIGQCAQLGSGAGGYQWVVGH